MPKTHAFRVVTQPLWNLLFRTRHPDLKSTDPLTHTCDPAAPVRLPGVGDALHGDLWGARHHARVPGRDDDGRGDGVCGASYIYDGHVDVIVKHQRKTRGAMIFRDKCK